MKRKKALGAESDPATHGDDASRTLRTIIELAIGSAEGNPLRAALTAHYTVYGNVLIIAPPAGAIFGV